MPLCVVFWCYEDEGGHLIGVWPAGEITAAHIAAENWCKLYEKPKEHLRYIHSYLGSVHTPTADI